MEKSKAHRLVDRLGGKITLDFPSLKTPAALEEQAQKDAVEKKRLEVIALHNKEMTYLREYGGSIDRIKYPGGEFAKQVLGEK